MKNMYFLVLLTALSLQCLPAKKTNSNQLKSEDTGATEKELTTACAIRDGISLSLREEATKNSERLEVLGGGAKLMCEKPEKEGYFTCETENNVKGYVYCLHDWLTCCEGIGVQQGEIFSNPIVAHEKPVTEMPITPCYVENIHHFVFGLKNPRLDIAPDKDPGNRGNRKYFYELKAGGGQAMQMRLANEPNSNRYWQIKNGQYEEMWEQNGFIYRGFDTSPGQDADGNFTTYIQQDIAASKGSERQLAEGARWMPIHRSSTDGPWFSPYTHAVTFFRNKDCGNPDTKGITNQYTHKNKMNLKGCVEDYAYKNKNGDIIKLGRVIVLNSDHEHYYYAKNYGLVGWHANWEGSGYISEDLTFQGDIDYPETTHCKRPVAANVN